MTRTHSFSAPLLTWFDRHGRKDLPWQRNTTPYRVWVSEIMLQQTQVNTVIPYYERFVQRFPEIKDLATAEEDQVLHLWAGLGYYARARNLHACAKQVVERFNGNFPSDLDELTSLPGIGRSTAGAILSIAFKQRAPILDGNVKRVLARYFAIEGWTGQAGVQKQLWEYAESLTPRENVAIYTQAIMDLGATVCTRSKPGCERCPVNAHCIARQTSSTHKLPQPRPRKNLPARHAYLLILTNERGEVLLEKRPQTGIWGGLWSLPQDTDRLSLFDAHREFDPVEEKAGNGVPAPFHHTFSHFRLKLDPVLARASARPTRVSESSQRCWYMPGAEHELGLPAPIKKLLENIKTDQT